MEKLCPRCGAYWSCGCVLEELAFPVTPGCEHDWTDAVGVELDVEELDAEKTRVLLCRLCGLYAVQDRDRV
jgi:hypothetical protein